MTFDLITGHLEIRTMSASEVDRADEITHLINRAYALAQTEIFVAPAQRIAKLDAVNLIANNEIVVVEHEGAAIGVVRVCPLDETSWFFGLLAVAPEWASRGVGRALLDAIERQATRAGVATMELDLLVPEPGTSHQARLQHWYESRGYIATSSRLFADVEPEVAHDLRFSTQLVRYVKSLAGRSSKRV